MYFFFIGDFLRVCFTKVGKIDLRITIYELRFLLFEAPNANRFHQHIAFIGTSSPSNHQHIFSISKLPTSAAAEQISTLIFIGTSFSSAHH
jgi:hypothetical protein